MSSKLQDWPHEENAQLKERIAELESDIRCMVEKAAANHRPAYDEQQRRISVLEQQRAEDITEITLLRGQLSALRAEREWVPVSEGLPESKGFDDGTIYVWVSDGDAHIGGICELAAWHEYWPVEKYIALPPLPTPPDTEGE